MVGANGEYVRDGRRRVGRDVLVDASFVGGVSSRVVVDFQDGSSTVESNLVDAIRGDVVEFADDRGRIGVSCEPPFDLVSHG